MSEAGSRIEAGLREAVEAARIAGEVATIIQQAQDEGVSATRTAYRILGHLRVINYHEAPGGDVRAA